jgi:hypothetical protein
MLVGHVNSINEANFSRLDTLKALAQIPPGFGGAVWTGRIDIIGPAVEQKSSRKLLH